MEHQEHKSKKPGCREWSKGLTVIACLCAIDICLFLVEIPIWKLLPWLFPFSPDALFVLVDILALSITIVFALRKRALPFVACVLFVALFHIVFCTIANVHIAFMRSDLVHSHYFIINTLYVVFYSIVGGYIFSRISRRCLLYFCLFIAVVVSAILLHYV